MKNLTGSVFAAALALGVASTQAQEASKEERPEVIAYRDKVRSNVQSALAPIGLSVMRNRSSTQRSINIGFPILENESLGEGARMDIQVGITGQKTIGQKEIASLVRNRTTYGVGISMKITF